MKIAERTDVFLQCSSLRSLHIVSGGWM